MTLTAPRTIAEMGAIAGVGMMGLGLVGSFLGNKSQRGIIPSEEQSDSLILFGFVVSVVSFIVSKPRSE
jgi:hypothetical protein